MPSLHLRSLMFVMAGLVLLGGCDLFGTKDAVLRQLSRQEAELVEADNVFGLDLFRTINATEPGQNLFISPLSVSMALGMALNGAEGETRAEMEEAMALAGLTKEEINTAYRSLIDLLADLDPSVTFGIANSIWYREGLAVEPAFIETNQRYFDAEVRAEDFNKPDAARAINGWVDEKTRGRIDKIIDRIDADVVMYLINAIYFKGTWQYEFDEALTRDAAFHRPDGSTVQVKMMQQERDVAYFRGDGFQAADLPYGDGLYSMTVLLPDEGTSVEELAAGLDAAAWNALTAAFQPRPLTFAMPRFKLEYEKTLNQALQDLGMEQAFVPHVADFSGISKTSDDLYIGHVLHKTFVEVDEKGTEAAAVTSIDIRTTSVGPSLRLDRPFLFALREQHSGTILFIGKITDPTG